MAYASRRRQISLRAYDLGISAKPVLVRFEHCVERILRCGHELGRRFLFAQSSLKIGVGFPYFARCGIARTGEFVLGCTQVGFCHVQLAIARKAVEDRQLYCEEPAERRPRIPEIL